MIFVGYSICHVHGKLLIDMNMSSQPAFCKALSMKRTIGSIAIPDKALEPFDVRFSHCLLWFV